MIECIISRIRQTSVRFVEHADAGVGGREGVAKIRSGVGGTIVDKKHLPIGNRLGDDTCHSLGKKPRGIISWYYYRDHFSIKKLKTIKASGFYHTTPKAERKFLTGTIQRLGETLLRL